MLAIADALAARGRKEVGASSCLIVSALRSVLVTSPVSLRLLFLLNRCTIAFFVAPMLYRRAKISPLPWVITSTFEKLINFFICHPFVPSDDQMPPYLQESITTNSGDDNGQ
jgi:hypothetical protein